MHTLTSRISPLSPNSGWKNKLTMRKRDAIVLLLICGFVLLNAGALRTGGSMRAKLLMCTTNMKKLGEVLPVYCDGYDGRMPYPASVVQGGLSYIKTPYEICMDPDRNATTPNDVWVNLGCLYKAELVSSGMLFYCPANPSGFAEYDSYCWSGSLDASGNKVRVPWGTTYNWPTYASSWWHVSAMKGYIFWPQSKHLLTQADFNVLSSQPGVNPAVRYRVGLPATPANFSDMNPNKAFSGDYQAHNVPGYSVGAVFGDGHVNMQNVPVDNGKYWYPYQSSPPAGATVSQWSERNTSEYMNALQP
jgi:hypothetical protein